jgi:hypothetical protein
LPRNLKLVPIGVDRVITRLMQERSGAEPITSLKEWRTILNELVAGERAENESLRAALESVVGAARFTQGLPEPLAEAIEAARAALKEQT